MQQAEEAVVALDLTEKFEEAIASDEDLGSNDEQVPCKVYIGFTS